jgi:polyamine oxidase
VVSTIIFAFFFSYKFCFCLFSYVLFDKHGRQVPQEIVTKVGETFEKIIKEVPHSFAHMYYLNDMALNQAISIVLERNPHLR